MNMIADDNFVKDLDQQARDILALNDRGGYTVPTEGLYPYQWNWDSVFTAWGFATYDIDRAWTEIETLFAGQWEDGRVPHILFHQISETYFPGPDEWQGRGPIPSSGIIQNPVAGAVIRWMFDANREASLPRVKALYPKIVKWHRWFVEERLDRGAVCVTHPWEARDNAPDWDKTMQLFDPGHVEPYKRRDLDHVDADMRPSMWEYDRFISLLRLGRSLDWNEKAIADKSPFRVADPSLTFMLLRSNRDLSAIGTALGEDVSEIDEWTTILEKGCETLWNEDEGYYDSRDVNHGHWNNCLSCASFLCWYAGVGNDRMTELLSQTLDALKYGVPSVAPSDPRFEAQRYWRGPVWGIVNVMIAEGLIEAGETTLGQRIKDATRQMIAEHGFVESFNPVDGSPSGGKTFTWTAAVWLGWQLSQDHG